MPSIGLRTFYYLIHMIVLWDRYYSYYLYLADEEKQKLKASDFTEILPLLNESQNCNPDLAKSRMCTPNQHAVLILTIKGIQTHWI